LPAPHMAGRAVLRTAYRNQILTAVLLEDTRALDRDLLERFEAIGREAWHDDRNVLHPALGELLEREVGRGLEPFAAAEPRLKCHNQFRLVEIEPLAQNPDRSNARGV